MSREQELRDKIASARRAMESIARSGGADVDKWTKDQDKIFDKAMADEKAAKSQLDFLTGSSDGEQRLQAKIARL